MSLCGFSIYTNVNGIYHFHEEMIRRPADTTVDFCLLNFDLYIVVWCNFNGFICFTIVIVLFFVRPVRPPFWPLCSTCGKEALTNMFSVRRNIGDRRFTARLMIPTLLWFT